MSSPTTEKASKFVLALQFWQGDRDAAMRNARRIADNEPTYREDIEFCFVARFDCPHDAATVAHVSKKFPVSIYTGFRRGTGWPHGCNELWCDFMQESIRRVNDGKWAHVSGVLTFEADCVPVARNWIDLLLAEWGAARDDGKLLLGCWLPNSPGDTGTGHINGNAIFHPLIARQLNLVGCSPTAGWDWILAPIMAPHWRKTDLIRTLYHIPDAPKVLITGPGESGVCPVLVHGVKDSVVEDYADRVLRKEKMTTAVK